MIAPRNTTVYKPRNFNYGKDAPIEKTKTKSVRKSHTPPVEGSWRDSNNYREQYFERNRGIGGYGYICSQCWKPMFKKENIQVDHIIPPSRFAIKKRKKGKWVKTSIMARFLNNTFNCAAICPDCNRRKSNKLDTRIIQGYAMKSLEVVYGVSQFVLALPFMATAALMWLTRKAIINGFNLFGSKGNKRRRRG